jgi:hypothetical protein
MNNDFITLLCQIVVVCFVGTWIVLGIGSIFAFWISKNVGFKKKWFPRFAVLVAVLFLLLSTSIMVLSSRSLNFLPFLTIEIPFLVLITYLNIKFTKVCDGCGATVQDLN